MRLTDRRLRRQLAVASAPLAGVLLVGLISSVLVIAQAWAMTDLVLAVLGHGHLARQAAVVVAVLALRGASGWVGEACSAQAAALVGRDLRHRIVAAVLRRTAAGESVPATGEVAALATRGVTEAEPYLTRYFPAAVLAAVLPVLTLVALATQDLLSTAIVLLTLPLMPVFGALVGLATRDQADRQWRAMASLSTHFLDVVRGLPTLVVHRRAQAQSAQIARLTDRYRRASLATLRLAFASSAVLELVATLSVALVAVVVGVRLAAGDLDLHTSLVVLLLAPEAYWPVRRMGAEFHAAAQGTSTFEAVEALEGFDPPQVVGQVPVTRDQADLVVSAVTVCRTSRGEVLRDLDLRVQAHGVTVLTGSSGCGKTTLLSAVAGLVPLRRGSITVGGLSVGDPSWQSNFALLPQRPVFVSGTVAENLRLAAPHATDSQLWDALRRVALEERVRELSHGLHTDVDEDGLSLSAGERARLALARIILADRPWVLLDEPTAHLDALTEHVILNTVVELGRHHGVLVVSHQPAVREAADRVLTISTLPLAVARRGPVAEATPVAARRQPMAEVGGDESSPHAGFALSTLLGAASSASGVALTATAGWLIVQASYRPAVLTLLVAIVGVRTFGLARPVLRYAERLRSHDSALRLLARRRVEVYDALVPLVPGALGRRRGDALAAVVDDVDSVVDRELRVRLPVRSFLLVVVLALLVGVVVYLPAGLAVGLTGLLAGFLAYALARFGTASAERDAVARRARLSAEVVETVQAAPEIAMWQAGEAALVRVTAASGHMGRALVRASWWTGAARSASLLLTGLGIAATAVVVKPAISAGDLSGPMAALLVLLPLALSDLSATLADAGALASRTAAAEQRLQVLEDTAPLVEEPAEPVASGHSIDVRLRRVDAGWEPGRSVIEGLDLEVSAGTRIAVTGPSGSGKSTLAALLLRFLDPSSGHVELGGTSTDRLSLDDLRRVVGLVDDDPHVFATTLVENVRLARPCADDRAVETVLREARLGPWLDALPEGLQTWLGDGHGQVSGGEKSRLAIARALLADQRVLVLDEPTAYLDHATAVELANEVLGVPRDRSIIWITHSPVGLDLVDNRVDLGLVSLGEPSPWSCSLTR